MCDLDEVKRDPKLWCAWTSQGTLRHPRTTFWCHRLYSRQCTQNIRRKKKVMVRLNTPRHSTTPENNNLKCCPRVSSNASSKHPKAFDDTQGQHFKMLSLGVVECLGVFRRTAFTTDCAPRLFTLHLTRLNTLRHPQDNLLISPT